MPAIPLGRESYKRSDGFQPEVELINLYLEEDKSGASPDNLMRLQRPGLSRAATDAAPSRGMFREDGVFGGLVFNAPGGQITRIEGDEITTIGAIANDGQLVEFAGTFEKLFCLSASMIYVWNGTTLSTLAIPDGYVPTSIDTLNSYLIIGTTTGRFYWLVPGKATIDPLNFATAESSPDGIVCARRLIDEIWFFGGQTTEPWQTTGDLNAPFQKASGRQFERGCLYRDTVRRFDNSLRWVGNDGLVYNAAQVPTETGGDGISERIAQRTDALSAWTFGVARHKFYALRIPGQGTFAYDPSTDAWSEFASSGEETWRAHVGVSDADNTYCGDYLTGAIWALDNNVFTDDGEQIRRAVTGSVPLMSRPFRDDSFALGIGISEDAVVKVRWKDGRDAWPAYFEELEARSPVDILTIYRLGMIEPPFRTFEVEVTDPVRVRISGAVIGEAWQ